MLLNTSKVYVSVACTHKFLILGFVFVFVLFLIFYSNYQMFSVTFCFSTVLFFLFWQYWVYEKIMQGQSALVWSE